MSDSQLKCKYQFHNDEDIIAVCINNDCKHSRLCCFTCMQDGLHDQHRKEILKFQQFNQWKQDGIKIIDQIKLVISEQENMIQLLKQLLIDNSKDIDLNIGYATATKIESSINQINKLKIIEQIVKNDLDLLSQIMKQKLKVFNSLLGQPQMQQQPIKKQIQIQEIVIQQQKIIPTAIQNIKIRFSQKDTHNSNQVTDEGKRVKSDGLFAFMIQRFCLCEPVLRKNVESTFAVKYISGNVDIGIGKRDIIRNANYQPKLYTIGHGSYLIDNNGSTFSHHQKEMNDKEQSFKFSDNDIIIVNVDLSKYKITWMHQQTKETFSMQLDQQESDYYPCICLHGGDAEIVDNF